ncbi:MAG: hypothetical protein PUG22_04620 [Peptoniphilaceae bacterium]|nr:hypothetical protein [Peptoniphilaceae bacterium]
MIETLMYRFLGIIAGVLIILICKFILKKIDETKQGVKNEQIKRALDLTEDVIRKAVGATNQTFVGKLKDEGDFGNKEANEAFKSTKESILKILDDESKKTLNHLYNNFDSYINNAIENEVLKQK